MKRSYLIIGLICLLFAACSDNGGNKAKTNDQASTPQSAEVTEEKVEKEVDPMSNKGIGPVSSVELGDVDDAMVAEGMELFKTKCSACHKIEKRYIGPKLAGVTTRRTPEWIMNMILNPEEMVANDPIAKKLLMEYNSPMANQSLVEDEARKILEYFRTI
ncbi:MAG TPA: cytochrome c [Bacteroidetes bacterium]|nr:cytochrome c [Bacteroidota bacterium]